MLNGTTTPRESTSVVRLDVPRRDVVPDDRVAAFVTTAIMELAGRGGTAVMLPLDQPINRPSARHTVAKSICAA